MQLNTNESECKRHVASGARLQRRCQREQEGRRSERTELRQARLDRRRIHSEESVAFGEGSIVSTCTDH